MPRWRVDITTSALTPFDNDTLRAPALGTLECALAMIKRVRLDANDQHLVAALGANQMLNVWRLARAGPCHSGFPFVSDDDRGYHAVSVNAAYAASLALVKRAFLHRSRSLLRGAPLMSISQSRP